MQNHVPLFDAPARMCDCCGLPQSECLHARLIEACLSDLVERSLSDNRSVREAARRQKEKLSGSPDFEADLVRSSFDRLRKLQEAVLALETIV